MLAYGTVFAVFFLVIKREGSRDAAINLGDDCSYFSTGASL